MCGPKTKNIGLLNAKHIMFFFFAQGYFLIGKLKIYIIRQFFDASSPHGNFFEKKIRYTHGDCVYQNTCLYPFSFGQPVVYRQTRTKI